MSTSGNPCNPCRRCKRMMITNVRTQAHLLTKLDHRNTTIVRNEKSGSRTICQRAHVCAKMQSQTQQLMSTRQCPEFAVAASWLHATVAPPSTFNHPGKSLAPSSKSAVAKLRRCANPWRSASRHRRRPAPKERRAAARQSRRQAAN